MSERRKQLAAKTSLLLKEPTNHGGIQLLRYGGVAFISFIADFGLLYICTSKLHWHYLLSTTVAFFVSAVVNYILSTWWVFSNRVARQRHIEMILFVVICSVALGLNDLFMWIFTSLMGIYYLASKLITVSIVFFWSFGARRYLFNRSMRAMLPNWLSNRIFAE